MTKKQRRSESGIGDRGSGIRTEAEEIKRAADVCLAEIADYNARIEALNAGAEIARQALEAEYKDRLEPLKQALKLSVSSLVDTMRTNKRELFDGTDIVYLSHGSLIHSIADKVSIPKTALAMCEELGFAEVIKIAKSLDREAVEKWPDEKLFLIGAERKQKEDFSYDLKKESHAEKEG